MNKTIQLDQLDNVVVALDDFEAGYQFDHHGKTVVLKSAISRGHKIAVSFIASGQNVIKYAYPIGHATQNIEVGEHVHSHNMETNLDGLIEYNYKPKFDDVVLDDKALIFKGFRRKNGEVGIRNEIWVVPTVGCVNGIGEKMIQSLRREIADLKVDAIEIFKHNYGCSQLGDDHENTRKILRDLVLHPNTGGVLVLGLGCENNQPDQFRDFLGAYDTERVKFLVTQKVKDEHADGVAILRELYDLAAQDVRVDVPISELKVGLKCGGSDGLSGITANPLLGAFSDFLISQGGTSVLTEVPEMFGAETILMNRAKDQNTFTQIVEMVNDFKNYFISNGQPVGENPSPGNKQGGITSLEEKSLGCTQKCGKATVKDVLAYGERISTKGLNLLSAPGNDLVASTALAAAGCQMVLFTTGRGTPFGSFVPTVKISTNNELFANKPHWIDFNAGEIVTGKSMPQLLDEFVKYLIDVANGQLVKNEVNNYREISIFKNGITL
jgi:altronate hydrolase